MKTIFTGLAIVLTVSGLILVTLSGFNTMRSGSRYFGASRRIDFNDPSTLDEAQREVRKGPLRVMGNAAKTVFHASTVALPTDELTIGIAAGQEAVSRGEKAMQRRLADRRKSALAALDKVDSREVQSQTKKRSGKKTSPKRSSAPIPSNSLAGIWNGYASMPSTENSSTEVVKPIRFAVKQIGGAVFECETKIKNDKEAPRVKDRVVHVGANRYVGKFKRHSGLKDKDWSSDEEGVLDLQLEGNLLKGSILMKTIFRRGKKITREEVIIRLELIR